MLRRQRFTVQGRVQGVGFRPFVFSLAEEFGLTGFVRNSPRGVLVEVQGDAIALEGFSDALEHRLPPLAQIRSLTSEQCAPIAGEDVFVISPSLPGESHAVQISPDIGTCPDCLADIADPHNRRYGYAFTNCTNCGPRYSITASIPYDRACTSMACFPMCSDCLAEYQNPRDRRFHAQPNACPTCGPSVVFLRKAETAPSSPYPGTRANPFPATEDSAALYGSDALRELAAELLQGKIAAVKGLGGFHLACDACNEQSLALLRTRKHRPHKPFAVMAASIDEVRRFARIGAQEQALLSSREKPIVICRMLPGVLGKGVSPDTASVGVMLPYTPLHTLLFGYLGEYAPSSRPLALVMTSGNPGGEPICLGNREALKKLGFMADVFLLHNRDILIRTDDSVVCVPPDGEALFFRRARGYTPGPVDLLRLSSVSGKGVAVGVACAEPDDEPYDEPYSNSYGEPEYADEQANRLPCVLGVGPELKNTLCYTKGNEAFVSQHVGDMSNLETAAFHREIADHMGALLKVKPELIVRDLHPDYLSSRMAEEFGKERDIPVLALQHHFAHAHAVLAEHAFAGKAIVLALDGTGLGDDGTLWGGEALYVDCGPETLEREGRPLHERVGSLAPMLLPGGEAAIREPWRIAHALLLRLGLGADRIDAGLAEKASGNAEGSGSLPWLPEHAGTAKFLPTILERRINCPESTSCGRLFDAVSALLGLCNVTTYEGQAAIRLEEAQFVDAAPDADSVRLEADGALYACPLRYGEPGTEERLVLDTHALFAALYADIEAGTPVPLVARRFHASLAVGLADMCRFLAEEKYVHHIGLSGGCLQNMTLARHLVGELKARKLIPLVHKHLPPGDGCISLGQASWGRLVTMGKRY